MAMGDRVDVEKVLRPYRPAAPGPALRARIASTARSRNVAAQTHQEESVMTDQIVKSPEAPPPVAESRPTPADRREPNAPLFHDDEGRGFRTRWEGIQTGFVDEPRTAVEQADALVVEMLKRLTDGFGNERAKLESQWSRGQDVSTEDLRIALKRYRSFFERLLSI